MRLYISIFYSICSIWVSIPCTEPEIGQDSNCAVYDASNANTHINGELATNLKFIWWPDDGDNVLEIGEATKIPPNFRVGGVPGGSLVAVPLTQLLTKGTLSDNIYNFFTGAYNANGGIAPVVGNSIQYVGKAWCFGEMTIIPLSEGTGSPLTRPGNFTCSGATVDNASQSDRVKGTLEFSAVQARNNPNFVCPTL